MIQLDPREADEWRSTLVKLFNDSNIRINERRFPGAQPISLVKDSKRLLLEQDFFVSEKSDGVRYLLFIANFGNAFLIDRKNDYYRVKLHVNTRNTLIDGELVIDRPKDESSPEIPRFLAFDLLLFNGTSLMHRPFHKRLGYLTQNVLKDYSKIPHPEAEFRLELKKLERSYALNIVWDSIPTLLHENDGLIFTSAEDPYAVGTCDSILKWKPPSMNSIDFRVDAVRMPDGDYKWDLSILESNQKYQLFGELVLDSEEMHRQWCADPPSGKIVECHYDAKWPTKWRFMRFRTDKNTPNHVSVVPKIMQSINEGIEIEELNDPEFLSEIRKNWKTREQQQKSLK